MGIFRNLENNIKLYIYLAVIVLFGTIGISLAAVFSNFSVDVNTTTSVIDAEITYDESINGSSITSNGNMLPIDDNLVTLSSNDNRILKVTFYVNGASGNPANTIYDIALRNANIDCALRTKDLKWRLYKEEELISSGNLSPSFDTMAGNRLVLTNTQEDLGSTPVKYTFMLWISESCTGDITECDSSLDQSKYLNKTLSADIKIELSTKTKKKITRITGSEDSCSYTPIEVPTCNNLTYNGEEQQLVNISNSVSGINNSNNNYKMLPLGASTIANTNSYTIINNTGTNAGKYAVTLKLEDGYKWTDGSTDEKCIYCTINKKDITVTTLDQNIEYGSKISNNLNNVSISGLIDSHYLNNITLDSSIVDIGEGIISINNILISDSNGKIVTNNYSIVKNNVGKVNISCVSLKFAMGDLKKVYDGEKLQIGIPDVSLKNGTLLEDIPIEVKYYSGDSCSESMLDDLPIEPGVYSVMASSGGHKNYCPTQKCVKLTIDKIVPDFSLSSNSVNLYYPGYSEDSPSYVDIQYEYAGSDDLTCTVSDSDIAECYIDFDSNIISIYASGTVGDTIVTIDSPSDEYTGSVSEKIYVNVSLEEYTITYDANGGDNAPAPQIKKYGEELYISTDIPTYGESMFLGWSYDPEADYVDYNPGDYIYDNCDITLYAVWGSPVTVTYDANGGENAPAPQVQKNGEEFKISTVIPTYGEYIFLGWSHDSEADYVEYYPGDDIYDEENVTLYAIWGVWGSTVTYDANGGENAPSPQKKVNDYELIITNDVPTKDGYIFLGWSINSEANYVDYIPGDGFYDNDDITLYAVWDDTLAYAIYSNDDNSLRFYKSSDNIVKGSTYNGRVVTEVYTGFEKIKSPNTGWSEYSYEIESVVFEDVISPYTTSNWFYYFYNCSSFDLEKLDVSNVTDMSSMFSFAGSNATTFELNLSNWNVSNATDMSYMFDSAGQSATTFELNLSNWNVLNVTDMSYMFDFAGRYATTFELNLSNWNVSSATDISKMFFYAGYSATSFTIVGLDNWDTSNVTDMNNMFLFAGHDATTWSIGDLSNWDTSSVTNMSGMFSGVGTGATTWSVGDLSNWDTSSVTNMVGMFSFAGGSATTWSVGDLSEWDVSNVTDMRAMFDYAGYKATTWSVGDLSEWDVSNVTDMNEMFLYAGSEATTWSVGDLSNWNVSNVTDMSNMFDSAGQNATTWSIGDLSNWDTSNVTDMSEMFDSAGERATTFELDLSNWDTSNVTDMSMMFYYCRKLTSLDLSGWDVSSVTKMDHMFSGIDNVTLALARSQADADKLNASVGKPTSWQFVSAAPAVEFNFNTPDNITVSVPELIEGGFTVLEVVCNSENQFVTSFKLNGEIIQGNKFTAPATSGTITISDVELITINYPDTVTVTGDYSGIILIAVDESKAVKSFKANGETINGALFVPSISNGTITISDIEFGANVFVVESEHNPYPNGLYGDDSSGVVYAEKTFAGATSLTVVLDYETESEWFDYVSLYDVNNVQVDGRNFGGTRREETITVDGNYIKILFRTDGSVNDYYGFKATITPNYD